ncbi:MAG: PQQ-binding-like beta-propeller repeat protein [Pirellulales bacterium]
MKSLSQLTRAGWAVLLLLSVAGSSLADWPQFRGPGSAGVADVSGLPAEWTATQNVQWTQRLPGYGASSPIVVGDRIYVTGYSGYGAEQGSQGSAADLQRHLACYNLADGQEMFNIAVQPKVQENEYSGFLNLHGYASSTPASDGERLYVFFGASGVYAFSLDGQQLWQQSVGDGTHGWGSASSPVVVGDLVIVNALVESGAVVALNKNTGQEVWRAEDVQEAWNTPVVVQVPGGRTELVISSQGEILGYDPQSGELLWRCRGIEDYVCPSVVAHDGIVYAIGGRGGAALAVRAGGRGDVTQSHRLWTLNKGANVCSPIYYRGHLYWVHDQRGMAYCADAATGELVYEERIAPRPGRIYGSPLLADGKLYIQTRENGTFVLAAKPEYVLVAHNPPLDESMANASPVAVDGRLLLRSNEYLYCISQ